MIRIRTRLHGLTLGLLLAGCASAPLHYYTLVAPAGGSEPVAAASPLSFELMPVNVPAQVDQPQLVVREGGQGVALLGSERWIAPLADEVRGALSADLVRQLHGADLSGMAAGEKLVKGRSMVSGKRLEFKLLSISGESCSIQNGNVFGN